MNLPRPSPRTLALLLSVAVLLLLFARVAAVSGPLAPVAVTVAEVRTASIAPALFGLGTVQARHTYRIGPTVPGRLLRLDVQVGDRVDAGQRIGEIDPVDLEARLRAQQAALQAAGAALRKAEATAAHAADQASRYERLRARGGTSEETVALRRQERAVADAARVAAREDLARLHAEREALQAQRDSLQLVAPAAGIVVARHVDPGTPVLAGQAVVELVDPESLWIDVRFDQSGADGLDAGLPAAVVLRSRPGMVLPGRVQRIEPRADAVTEEMLAKIAFDRLPQPLPPLGELAEVTVRLPPLPAAPTVPNAAIRVHEGRRGVWKLIDGEPGFVPVEFGRGNLDGEVQVRHGLAAGDRVVVHSERALADGRRLRIVDRIAGSAR